jgi:hypothetical protein
MPVCLCCRLLEPGEESLPQWMSDASPELCGHLRLSAAGALLRLARRHDTRISPSIYCALALMMQDEVEGVRAAFAAKVHKLIRHFQVREQQCTQPGGCLFTERLVGER